MVDFRRCITALAILAFFVGLGSAQVTGVGATESCAVTVPVTPVLRAEGYTEQTGDVTLTCTGGTAPALGAPIVTTNITVFFNAPVTSRLLPIATGVPATSTNASSEALLLVDEPGSGLAGVGPAEPQALCGTPLTGCTSYVAPVAVVLASNGLTVPAGDMVNCTTLTGVNCTTAATTNPLNVYQGIVAGNSVTFYGVPVLPPTTAGSARVYRVTNLRVNANFLGASAGAGTPVIASVFTGGNVAITITNGSPTVGFVQSSLAAAPSSVSNQNQCSSATKTSVNTLTFTENFPTAFKTRVLATANSAYAGQSFVSAALAAQATPGAIYNSESNFIFPVTGGGIAGLADFGTRLKATFSNVPAGQRLFVSVSNVINNNLPVPIPAVPGGSTANVGTTNGGFAQLINSESSVDGSSGGALTGLVPTSENAPTGSGNVPVAEIPVINGSATAVWEVINTSPNQTEALKFGVYSTFSANALPIGAGVNVNLSYAPSVGTAFTAGAGGAASSTLAVPRFIADPGSAKNIVNVVICRTVLLYPFVTNINGFDTGLAIANTTADPFGTTAQSSNCKLNWYQGATNPPQGDTGTINAGSVYTTLASLAVPGFQGYMIAICNFQFAHGFAFVSDLGASKLAMGYLAVVVADPGTGSRASQPGGCIGVSGCNSGGEQGGH